MKEINAYLIFNGNCREAMTFYQKCLGAELQLITFWLTWAAMCHRKPKTGSRMPESVRAQPS